MKLWNHMVRVDHQLNGSNSWSARYLAENSPTYDRISGRRTQVAKDQEFDIDRTVVATWNAVFGNTRFNTLARRVHLREERLHRARKCRTACR